MSEFESRLRRSLTPAAHLAFERCSRARWGDNFLRAEPALTAEDKRGIDVHVQLRGSRCSVQIKGQWTRQPTYVPFELTKPGAAPGWLWTLQPTVVDLLLIPWWLHGSGVWLPTADLAKLREHVNAFAAYYESVEYPDGSALLLVPRWTLREMFGPNFVEVNFRPLNRKDTILPPEVELELARRSM